MPNKQDLGDSMPRGQKPLDPDDGPLAAFAHDLRLLREKNGNTPYRVLAKRAGFAASTLSVAASGTVLPSLDVTVAYVQACGADPQPWRERWQRLATEQARHVVPPTPPDAVSPLPNSLWRRRWLLAAALVTVLGMTAALVLANVAGNHPTPPQLVSQHHRYDQTIGPGCPNTPEARTTPDSFSANHYWAQTTATNWDVPRCSNLVLYSQPTNATDPDRWQNDYYWYFDNVPTAAECTFHIYIPDTTYSQYAASYDWTTGVTNYLDANSFLVRQSAYLGHWYDEGPYNFLTGQAEMLLTDARSGGPNAPLTAAAVRLTCD